MDETVEYSHVIDFTSFANGVLEAYREVYGELKAVPVSFRKEIYENDKSGKNGERARKTVCQKSWKILDRLLALADLSRAEVYLTEAVRYPTPKNRMPNRKEIGACKEFLQVQLEAVQPKLIVALGKVALQTLGIRVRCRY